ncbi:MAG: prepilin-type N-terminal cleavage/methylation domain-containing protein, partial [Casimicrobiaceae bacterium]
MGRRAPACDRSATAAPRGTRGPAHYNRAMSSPPAIVAARRTRAAAGFTLIEIMVVIVILGVL